jgi:hypothetical protein
MRVCSAAQDLFEDRSDSELRLSSRSHAPTPDTDGRQPQPKPPNPRPVTLLWSGWWYRWDTRRNPSKSMSHNTARLWRRLIRRQVDQRVGELDEWETWASRKICRRGQLSCPNASSDGLLAGPRLI